MKLSMVCMYDPVTCKMLSPDIVVQNIENTGGYDPYGYAFNNPLKYNDPTGFLAARPRSLAPETNFDNFNETNYHTFIYGTSTTAWQDHGFDGNGGSSSFTGEGDQSGSGQDGGGDTDQNEKQKSTATNGNDQVQAAMAFAFVVSAVDGPLPFGEIVGTVVVLGAVIFSDNTNEFEGPFMPENGYYTERPVGYVPNEMQGFDPSKFNGGSPPNDLVKWALIGVGAYEIYKNYQKMIENHQVPEAAPVDNTYVAPTIYPTPEWRQNSNIDVR